MWRWVTRGLVLTVLALCIPTALHAQDLIAALDFPDPSVPNSGMILVKGWVLDPVSVTKIELYVDDQFQYNLNKGLPRIDVLEAYPNYPGIQNIAPGFQSGFQANRFTNGAHTVMVKVYFQDGRVFELGRRTILIDNTINQAPFGSVDIPDASGIYNASGSFPVVGWALDTDGIGRVDIVENRLVGMKSHGIYETPGGAILTEALRDLETLTLDRDAMHFKEVVALRYAELVYNGQWYTPLRQAIDSFVNILQKRTTGTVRLKLYKGSVNTVGRKAPRGLYREDYASFDDEEVYNHKDAEGFIRLFGLPMKIRALVDYNMPAIDEVEMFTRFKRD